MMADDDRTYCILDLGDELGRAASPEAVHAALAAGAVDILGALRAWVFTRHDAQEDYTVFRPVRGAAGAGAAPFTTSWPMETAAVAARGHDGAPHDALFAAIPRPDAGAVVHAPIDSASMLVLAFADPHHSVGASGWRILASICRQAGSALERVDALRRVRELMLRDPDTGLGNRRLVEVVLQHSFAQARRGEPLSVVSIRGPDPAAAVPTAGPHNRLAALLSEHARGSDVVARFEDDVYVVVLHAAPARGAEAFLRRVRNAFGNGDMSCAVAEHDGTFENSHALLEAVLRRVDTPAVVN